MSSRPMPQLIVKLKGRELQRFMIDAVQTTIGRDHTCDVVLDNTGVSRSHASVLVDGEAFYAVDHDSSNGILVNGESKSRHQLKEGDEIQIGKFQIEFSTTGGVSIDQLKSVKEKKRQGNIGSAAAFVNTDRTTALSVHDMQKLSAQLQRPEGQVDKPSSPSLHAPTSARLERSKSDQGSQKLYLILGVSVAVIIALSVMLMSR